MKSETAATIARRLFRAKEQRRRALARLPLERKVKIVATMQKMAREIRAIVGVSRTS